MTSETVQKLHEQVLYPCVLVYTRKASGSGTVIYSAPKPNDKRGESETYVITNFHVIEEAVSVKEEFDSLISKKVMRESRATVHCAFYKYNYLSVNIGQEAVEADIMAYDKEQDLALLRLRTLEPVRHIGTMRRGDSEDIHIFDPVIACGCALSHPPVPTRGNISSLKDEIDNHNYWMSSAPTIYGNSGGSVYLVETLEWIGIPSRIAVTMSGFGATDAITHMSYFIPYPRVYKWFKTEMFQFLVDSNYTSDQCQKMRDKRKEESKKAWERSHKDEEDSDGGVSEDDGIPGYNIG